MKLEATIKRRLKKSPTQHAKPSPGEEQKQNKLIKEKIKMTDSLNN